MNVKGFISSWRQRAKQPQKSYHKGHFYHHLLYCSGLGRNGLIYFLFPSSFPAIEFWQNCLI